MQQSSYAKSGRSQGFTIVEVLITISVGALLLLFTFMMVPQLQRNSRNSQRKQDVASILQAISRWELNHSGNIPANSDSYLDAARLTIYDRAGGFIRIIPTADAASSTPHMPLTSASDIERVDIYKYQKCSSTLPGGSTNIGAGYHDVVALFALESRNAAHPTPQCVEL